MTRQRWRMTLDNLCLQAETDPVELETWCRLGALGPRWTEPRLNGRWRHITREAAQRAVIMRVILDAGFRPEPAAAAAATHRVGDMSDLIIQSNVHPGITITVQRSELELP